MSEERHVPAPATTPDVTGSAKPANGGESPAHVAVAEDEPRPAPKAPAKPAAPPRPGESTLKVGEGTKRRAKLTLKIPDDEVARPSSTTPAAPPVKAAVEARPEPPPPAPAPPAPAPPPPPDDAVVVTPMRIITIEPPPPESPAPPVKLTPSRPPPGPAPGTTQTREDSWTPYQPLVGERPALAPPAAPAPTLAPAIPPPGAPRAPRPSYHSPPPQPASPPTAERKSLPAEPVAAPAAPAPPSPPSATGPMEPPTQRRLDSVDDIPVEAIDSEPADAAEPLELDEPELETSPRATIPTAAPQPEPRASPAAAPAAILPSAIVPVAGQAPVAIKDLPPMRALAPTEPEGLEVQFDEEEAVTAPRPSEPEAELEIDDVVSVESAPTLAAAPVPPVPASGERISQVGSPPRPFTQAAMIPIVGSASPVSKSIPPPPKGASAAGAKGQQTRVIVPTASPLAPPAMTDSVALQSGGRKKARPWWEELFNDDFIRTMAKISDEQIAREVDFIEESLAVAQGAMLLDLACGTGRHAIELTRRGYKVVGFDLSLPMLARAAEEAQERSQKLNFVQGDMREMTFEDTFDGIYSWATSFGFFEEEKNAAVVAKVHKALKKGGQFLLDVVNRDYIVRQAPSLAWFEGEGCVCMDEMSIDWITSRMKVKRTMMMDDGRSKEIDYSVRVYSLHELGKILHEAGFRVAEVSGRCATPGVFFGNESPRTMILAEKK